MLKQMKFCLEYLRCLKKDEKGQAMVEYGLLIALIAVVVIGALVVLGPQIKDMFDGVTEKLTPTAG